MKKVIYNIAEQSNIKISSFNSVSGGSISSAFLLEDDKQKYFLKVNNSLEAMGMFEDELKGLRAIEQTNTISVPTVHLMGKSNGYSFILMDFIEQKRPDNNDYSQLANNLAMMHSTTQKEFGFSSDNYIGSIPQSNSEHKIWSEFYWFERILPQLKMAVNKRQLSLSDIPNEEKVIKILENIFGNITPSLIHGDLWSGNCLISKSGIPYLIDPAVYYGDSMADIAMSKLFGGFGQKFYDEYHNVIAKQDNYNERIDLHQLYYLLVHLNLFGSGYYSAVSSILNRYLLR